MKPFYFEHKCAKCGYTFLSPRLGDQSYGLFLLRTKLCEVAFLDSFVDGAFDEVSNLFDEQKPKYSWINNDELLVKVFHWVYKITCDSAPSGLEYCLDQLPRCPKCYSYKMVSSKETYPPQLGEEDLPVVTHKHWDSLSLEKKKQAVIQAIEDYYREEYPNYLAHRARIIEEAKKLKPYKKENSSANKT